MVKWNGQIAVCRKNIVRCRSLGEVVLKITEREQFLETIPLMSHSHTFLLNQTIAQPLFDSLTS
jgi:hypothetical protein